MSSTNFALTTPAKTTAHRLHLFNLSISRLTISRTSLCLAARTASLRRAAPRACSRRIKSSMFSPPQLRTRARPVCYKSSPSKQLLISLDDSLFARTLGNGSTLLVYPSPHTPPLTAILARLRVYADWGYLHGNV